MGELIAYDPENEEHFGVAALAHVYILAEGNLDALLDPKYYDTYTFVHALQSGVLFACFCVDEKGPWMLVTAQPWLSGVVIGTWVRHDHRCGKEMVRRVFEAYELALQTAPVLISFTVNPRLNKVMLKMGYTYKGTIPHVAGGKDLNVYSMLRCEFNDYRKKLGLI